MNELVLNAETAALPIPSLRRSPRARRPVIYLKGAVEHPEQYQEIMSIKDPDHVAQGMAIGGLLTNAIDEFGRFNAATARKLITDFNLSLPPAESRYSLVITDTLNTKLTQQNALVSVMIDSLLDVLKKVIGIALDPTAIGQIQAAVTDAFTNLETQQGDAWIFWEKKEQQKTVYSYALLFAIQDELTGYVMVALPMSLNIVVDVAFEQVLGITITNRESYSVTVEAMKVAQLLYPKSPDRLGLMRMMYAVPSDMTEADDVTLDDVTLDDVTNIEVKNYAGTITFATAAKGKLHEADGLTQLSTEGAVIHQPLTEETRYVVFYHIGGHRRKLGMVFNAEMGPGELWFVSR